MSLGDLRSGDQLSLTHTDKILKLAATRVLQAVGEIKAITSETRTLAVELEDPVATVRFEIAEDASITDLSADVIRPWSFLRRGDQVVLDHMAVDLIEPVATAVSVRPKAWDDRWAIVVACGDYDDAQVSPIPAAQPDSEQLQTALTTYYRVPASQFVLLTNPTRLAFQDQLDRTLGQIRPNDQLILFFVGHGYLDGNAEPWLAMKEFELARIEETGLSLRGLIRQLEQFSTRETLLFLETSHASPGVDRKLEPAASELVEPLKRSPVHPVSTAVTIFASSDAGQRGQQLGVNRPDVFTQAVAETWIAGNDPNADGAIDADEMIQSLPLRVNELARQSRLQPQTPIRFLADDRPPRLTPEQRESVLTLMEGLGASRFEEVFKTRYESLQPGLDNIPDGDLAYGLVALKHNIRTDSRRMFERVVSRYPDSTIAYQGLALQNATSRRFDTMLELLVKMVEHMPPRLDPVDEQYARSAMQMAGALRQFLLDNPEVDWSLEDVRELDELVLKQSEDLQNAFKEGVESAREIRREKERSLKTETDDSQRKRLEDEVNRATTYADLDVQAAAAYLRFHLDDR